MRVVLADLQSRRGFVSKDTVAGGYGSRFEPFSRVTSVFARVKQQYHDLPSVQMAYLAAIVARAGHDVRWTREEALDGDVALVLSSLVDYRHETAWADRMRARGVKVGFVGITASKMPELFRDHADFILKGEPEAGVMRLAGEDIPCGDVVSDPIADLDSLPFPRWDVVATDRNRHWMTTPWARRSGRAFPLLASRGCPEFCTYCPHRILAGYRARSIGNIANELEQLCDRYPRPHVIFRDPLFTEQRERCLALADEIRARALRVTFDAETRLDRLDPALLDALYAAGLRAITFGVESLSPDTLKKAGRRPIPPVHERTVIAHCRTRGIVTAAFYVFGFLPDDWPSIAATIEYATDLGSTFAQFKLLTPYPGTPMFKQLAPMLTQPDWEKFDGYSPTFTHPQLSDRELRFLLGAAYTRFYMRPSFLANVMQIQNAAVRRWLRRLDRWVTAYHAREEIARWSRAVAC